MTNLFFFFLIFKPLIFFFLFDVDFYKSIVGFHYIYIFFILAKFQNNQIFLFKWVSPLLFCRSFFLSYAIRLLSLRVSYRAAFFFPLFRGVNNHGRRRFTNFREDEINFGGRRNYHYI